MDNKKITALIFSCGEHPQLAEIDNTLQKMQDIVGGFIETIYPFDDNVAIVVNEDGKLMHLAQNRELRDKHMEVQDILVGNFLIVGTAGDEFSSLTYEQVNRYYQMFYEPIGSKPNIIKGTSNLEFVLKYADGTTATVNKGVLFEEGEDNHLRVHVGTDNFLNTLISILDAVAQIIGIDDEEDEE